MSQIVELNVKKLIKQLMLAEKKLALAHPEWKRWIIKLQPYLTYYRADGTRHLGFVQFVADATVYESYEIATAKLKELLDIYPYNRDFMIVVHAPDLDVINPHS